MTTTIKRNRFFLLLLIFLLLFSNSLPSATVYAYHYAAAPVIPSEKDVPSADCVMLGWEGKYITDVDNALARINEIRYEACVEGVTNPATGQPLTPADYVPIKWSYDLEYIARIRAAEASITNDHARLNNGSIWDLHGPNGIRSRGEVIAWNWSETMTDGINQWYGEKADWVNKTANAVTGHYTAMIDPTHTYVGLGTFCTSRAKYYNTTAGEFAGGAGLSEARIDMSGDCIQLLEVSKNFIGNYTIEQAGDINTTGAADLKISASVSLTDYWGRPLVTNGLALTTPVQWISSDNSIAVVENDNHLTLKQCGEATISAQLNGVTISSQKISRAHNYGVWTVAVEPTVNNTGTEKRTCTLCGAEETREIPKKEPETTAAPSKPETTEPDSSESETETSDILDISETTETSVSESPTAETSLENLTTAPINTTETDSTVLVSADDTVQQSNTGSGLIWILLIVAVLAVIVVLIIRKRDKKSKE